MPPLVERRGRRRRWGQQTALATLCVTVGVLAATPASARIILPSIPYQGFAWIDGPYCAFGQGQWWDNETAVDASPGVSIVAATSSKRFAGCTVDSPAAADVFAAQAVLLVEIYPHGYVSCGYQHESNTYGSAFVAATKQVKDCGAMGRRCGDWALLQAQWRITYHGAAWRDHANSWTRKVDQCD